ncbi:hypothetical protein ACFV9D_35050 [Streptomyces sp. NPDC059875]|uniref:hypothetical protein n=1 Tax=unclassified Streptomyces TaxID=2593676 RepID=UPI00364D7EEF
MIAARPAPDAKGTPPAPKSVCGTLELLLEQATPEHAAAALTALPDRTVETMLAGGSLPGPVLTSAVTRHGDSRTRVALARHPRIDARVLKDLVAADDPAANAAVYRNPRCTPSLRRIIVHALDRVPLDEGLRAELLSPAARASRSRTAPLLACGDPQLVAQALGWGVRKVAQRYALLRVWECRGADAVRAMLGDPAVVPYVHADVLAEVTAALDVPDGAALLREGVEPYDDPTALPRLLSSSRGTSTLRDLLNEPYTHDFRVLAAANRQTPFMPKAAQELVRHEDATDSERREFHLTLLNEPWRAGGRIAGNLTPPAQRLAEEVLDDTAAEWAPGVVRAGLLDPAELVTTARPAARALQALHVVTEEGLGAESAQDVFAGLVRHHLTGRPDAWQVLREILPRHPGSLTEAVQEATGTADGAQPVRAMTAVAHPADAQHAGAQPGGAEAVDAGPSDALSTDAAPADARSADTTPVRAAPDQPPSVPDLPPSAPDLPPSAPVGERGRAALGAIDLLRTLARPNAAPLPDDPAVLRYLSDNRAADSPGWQHPDWLREACLAQGLHDLAHRCDAPTRQEALSWIKEAADARSLARVAERAYLHGILQTDDLLAHLPAALFLRLQHDWQGLAFVMAWRSSLASFLERELGTEVKAWLGLAAAARDVAATAIDTRGQQTATTWPELLDRSRLDSRSAADMLSEACEGIGTPSTSCSTVAPTTVEEALHLLARGDHLWAWPLGTLLCLATPEVVAALLPHLGPDGPWMLAAFLLRRSPTEHTPFEYLLCLRDTGALRVLSEQRRWLDDNATLRLLDLADPDVDLAVLRTTSDPRAPRRIVARPGSLAPRLVAELRADPLAEVPGHTAWLESAEPELIELVFERAGKRLTLAQQLVGCLSLLCHAGRERLAALADSGRLGATATRLCHKALTADDPAAPLAARVEKELAPDRLGQRLRRTKGHWHTREILDSTPGTPPWEALEAEHRREPIPEWEHLVRHPEAPHAFTLRNAEHLHELSLRTLRQGRELVVARARHGVGGYSREPVDALLDHLLRAEQLTGRDLIRHAAPTTIVLSYLNRARRRSDAPKEVHNALSEAAELVRDRLGDEPRTWQRLYAVLTEQASDWDPEVSTSELMSAL